METFYVEDYCPSAKAVSLVVIFYVDLLEMKVIWSLVIWELVFNISISDVL